MADKQRAIVRALTVAALGSTLVRVGSSQSTLYTFHGDSDGDLLGYSVGNAGDVNGDGYSDLIAGAPYDEPNGDRSGSASVFSGKDGTVLFKFAGDTTIDYFGHSVAGAGDVNGDGFDDVICGAPQFYNPGAGYARVLSGKDGSVLHEIHGGGNAGELGMAVAGAGDMNHDGLADFIVTAATGPPGHQVRVFSGLDGSILLEFSASNDLLGSSVSGAGDVNSDGYPDLIAGAPLADINGKNSGSAQVFSGLDGQALYQFDGDSHGDLFGTSVSGAGDVNGDGYDDLIVGAKGDDNNGSSSGSARVFSGLDGSVLYTLDGDSKGDEFGFSVSGAGDVDRDGYDDLLVGAPYDDNNGSRSGTARVHSGLDGAVIFVFDGNGADHRLGYSVSRAGDVNGDASVDLIVGAIGESANGGNSGSARVLSGCDDCGGPIGMNYCGPANFNSTGQSAVISAFGTPKASANACVLTASQLPQRVWGYFLNSDVQGFQAFPPGSNGNLCLGGGIGRHVKQVGNSGTAGELVIAVDLSALPRPGGTHSVVAGETWNFQCWFRDNQGGPTSNFTDGMEIVFK